MSCVLNECASDVIVVGCSLCKQMGGTNASLASIHSYEENWYILNKLLEYNLDDYYTPDAWIGFSKYTYGRC